MAIKKASSSTGAAAAPALAPAAAAPKKRATPAKAVTAAAPKKAAQKKAAVKETIEPVISLAVLQDEIRSEAYSYFIQRGYRPGDPVADWHQAEDTVLRRHGLR